jgi:pimeloyl-ACP methyl ester carboxylesterase
VLLSSDRISQPLLVLWGDADPFTPADGPVGRFFQALPDTRLNTRFSFLPSVGHCPHDDRPDLVHSELLPWLGVVHKQQ